MSSAIRSIASLRPSLPSAVGISSAIPASAVAAQLEGLHQLVLGVGELVGGVEALDPLQQALGGAAVGGDLGLELSSVEALRRVLEPAEELLRELVRLGRRSSRGRRRSSRSRAPCAR